MIFVKDRIDNDIFIFKLEKLNLSLFEIYLSDVRLLEQDLHKDYNNSGCYFPLEADLSSSKEDSNPSPYLPQPTDRKLPHILTKP